MRFFLQFLVRLVAPDGRSAKVETNEPGY